MHSNDSDTALSYSVWGGADGWYVHGWTSDAVIREMQGPFVDRADAQRVADRVNAAALPGTDSTKEESS